MHVMTAVGGVDAAIAARIAHRARVVVDRLGRRHAAHDLRPGGREVGFGVAAGLERREDGDDRGTLPGAETHGGGSGARGGVVLPAGGNGKGDVRNGLDLGGRGSDATNENEGSKATTAHGRPRVNAAAV